MAFTAAQIPHISGRRYPAALAGRLYPHGIPIVPEEELSALIRRRHINQVVFSYSDIAHEQLMHTASLVLACGADFRFMGPDATMLKSSRPVVSVCAVRTGCGKSQVVRYFCDILRERGVRPVVVRHPMPYGDLALQAVERFEPVPIWTGFTAPSRSGRSTSICWPAAPWSLPGSITGGSCGGPRRRRGSSSGTGGTTISPFFAPTWKSSWPIRSGRGTKRPGIPAR